jgi:hypothetical protein
MKIRCFALPLALMAIVWGQSAPSAAETHVVSPQAVRAELEASAAQRAQDLAALNGVLASPGAAQTARRYGADIRVARQALAGLSDSELRDLAARAQSLRMDPAAGLSHDVNDLLVVFLIVAIVILVIKAVD